MGNTEKLAGRGSLEPKNPSPHPSKKAVLDAAGRIESINVPAERIWVPVGRGDDSLSILLHWHSFYDCSTGILADRTATRNIQSRFSGGSGRGVQEQTRRVCDAVTDNNANAQSIRKRSAGYAMRFKSILPQFSSFHWTLPIDKKREKKYNNSKCA